MTIEKNGSANGNLSTRVPIQVRRVIAFGYYDGPTDGVLETVEGAIYRFNLIGEVDDQFRPDGRSFTLRPLADTAFDQLVAILAPHQTPTWPVWVPAWTFLNAIVQQDAEARTDAILGDAGPVAWEVIETDPGFSLLTATRPVTATGMRLDAR